MSLKKISQFNYFDVESFLDKLKLVTTGVVPWKEYGTGIKKGTKVELVIARDGHKYASTEGEIVSNIYEKLIVKIPKEITVPMNVEVKLVNAEATIYGEYRNQLAITAEDIQIVNKS